MFRVTLLAGLLLLPFAAAANERITQRSEFVERIANRDLTRLGIGVQVTPGGEIRGSAFGTRLTGSWGWNGQMFCREMQWGSRTFDYSCQDVFVRNGKVYFQPRSGDAVYLNLS